MILSNKATTNTSMTISDITPPKVEANVQFLCATSASLSATLATSKSSQEAFQLQVYTLCGQFAILQAALSSSTLPLAPPPSSSIPADLALSIKDLITQVLLEKNLVPSQLVLPPNCATLDQDSHKSRRLDQNFGYSDISSLWPL
jgi:hypothetical protein